MIEYNPNRIKRTIKRFEGDQEDISNRIQKNLDEIGKEMRAVEAANRRIVNLRTENKNLDSDFKKISGKIDGLNMVLNDQIDPEE